MPEGSGLALNLLEVDLVLFAQFRRIIMNKISHEHTTVGKEGTGSRLRQLATTILPGRHYGRYKQALITETEKLHVPGRPQPLDLDRAYVPLQLSEFRPEDVQRIGSEAESALDQIVAARRKVWGIQKALRKSSKLVVLGHPGTGKTTLLKYLAFTFAHDRWPDNTRQVTSEHHDRAIEYLIPIFVSLPSFAESGKDMISYLVELFAEHDFPHAGRFIEEKLQHGECLLLLDELNKVVVQKRVSSEIARFVADYSRNHVIVTSRLLDYREPLAHFTAFEIVGVGYDEMKTFVQNWFSERPEQANGLLLALELNPQLRSFASHPFFLPILAVAHERNWQPPVRCSALFEECARILLDEGSGLETTGRAPRFDGRTKEKALQGIAYHFHNRKERVFPRDALLAKMTEALRQAQEEPQGKQSSGQALSAASEMGDENEELLDEILDTCILRPSSKDSYEFAHLAWQEYFTAKALFEEGEFSPIIKCIDDPWWQQVIVFLAGQQRDAANLIKMIRERSEIPDAALLLTARCLAEADQTDEETREAILAELSVTFQQDAPGPSTGLRTGLWDEAASAIARIEGRGVQETFLGFLKSDDPELREKAAGALGRLGGEWAVTPLIAALWDKEGKVRRRVAWALGQIQDERAAQHLCRALGDEKKEVRQEALEALKAIGEPAVMFLTRTLSDPREHMRELATMALSRIGAPAIRPLISTLGSKDQAGEEAARVLVNIGSPAVESLAATLGDARLYAYTRRKAAETLGLIGGERATKSLIAALGDADKAVRQEAIKALARIGAPAVGPLIMALTDTRSEMRDGAVEALGQVGQPAMEGLLQALGDERRGLRQGVAQALQKLGVGDEQVMEGLIAYLEHEKWEVRGVAVEVLGHVGGESALGALITALEDENRIVYRKAAEALHTIGGDKVVPRLKEALHEAEDPERIIESLSIIRGNAAKKFLHEILQGTDLNGRSIAARVLRDSYREDASYVHYRASERRIEELLLRVGVVHESMLAGIPTEYRELVLREYVEQHPLMELIYNPSRRTLKLEHFSRYQKVFELWDVAVRHLGRTEVDDQIFAQCVTQLADLLFDILGVEKLTAENYKRLHAFTLDTSVAFRRTKLPATLPLVFLQCEEPHQDDFEDLRYFLSEQPKSKTSLLVLFCEGEALERARRLLDDSLRTIHAYDVITLGRDDIQRLILAKDSQEALRFAIFRQTVDLTLVSPFETIGPVREDMFFGRESEIRFITQTVKNKPVAVLGGRRIGKTSVLQKVRRLLIQPTSEYRCVYVDCYHVRDCGHLFRMIARDSGCPEVRALDPTPINFMDVVDILHDDGLPLFIMDEIDALLRSDMKNDEWLFKTFRSLSQKGACRFIFSGEKCVSERLKSPGSPFFNFCEPIFLGYLDNRSARKLITDPMALMNIELRDPDGIVREIIDLSSCHPRIVQLICRRLIEEINKEKVRHISYEHLQRVSRDRAFQNQYVDSVWSSTTSLERIITLLLNDDGATLSEIEAALRKAEVTYTTTELDTALSNLEMYSILKQVERLYCFVPKRFPGIVRECMDIDREIEKCKREVQSEKDWKSHL
jgi:HEAT repeat protein/Cdc6-like AAA superfamily ATPase